MVTVTGEFSDYKELQKAAPARCLVQWFSTGVPRKTSVPWKIVRCSAGNL